MRIAHHHTSTLAYCREFNIPLTTFTNYNEAAWLLAKNGTKRRIREVDADVRGYTAELLAKSLHRADLEQPLTKEDRERLIEYLRDEGRLDQALAYQKRGDTSGSLGHMEHVRGYAKSPGAFEGPGMPVDAVDLEALIKASYMHADLHDHDLNQQSTMLTPSGGMDQIPYGFAARLGRAIRYETEVQEIRRTADGRVRVVARDNGAANATFEETADFCVCALPPNLLMKLPNDFATETASALRKAIADTAGKIGLQFKRRFWEQDDDIYGGRSLSPDPITQIYYPCEDFGATDQRR
jgi:monoamine oxidase